KILNEKTRKNKIPWKIKRKGIDNKLESINIFDEAIKNFEKNKNNFSAKAARASRTFWRASLPTTAWK
ncbi:MAG: hypothetical protein II427_02210, partial [Firmicutes bacterium]|nr:hypothetical protein [Bacillota bacterium]